MKRSTNPRSFLTPNQSAAVADAIAAAERRTSAEIKLILVRHCWSDICAKAEHIFRKHGLHNTKARNAVLILLVTTNREFIIYGDQGIHERVGQDFWDDVRDGMAERFRLNQFAEGLCEAVGRIGEKLAAHFPWTETDENEIPDAVDMEK